MSYALFTHGSVAIVEWGTPALIDLDTLVAELRPVRARGAPVMVIAYVAEGSPAPESEVQREMGRRMGELASLWSSGHVVFEGTASFSHSSGACSPECSSRVSV